MAKNAVHAFLIGTIPSLLKCSHAVAILVVDTAIFFHVYEYWLTNLDYKSCTEGPNVRQLLVGALGLGKDPSYFLLYDSLVDPYP